jgi:bifunctional DNA-binding transcriptional regulator/antitoxin component of YhaV-PrlF toxin-antitoxin module
VIPRSVREQVGIGVGDLLEARVERGKITFSPKSVVDRAVAEGWRTFEKAACKDLLTPWRTCSHPSRENAASPAPEKPLGFEEVV